MDSEKKSSNSVQSKWLDDEKEHQLYYIVKKFNSFISPINGILLWLTTPGHSRPGSNNNEWLLHIPLSFMSDSTSFDAI